MRNEPSESKGKSQFLVFVIVGVVNTAFGYGVYASFVFVDFPASIALIVSSVVGVIFNFFTSGNIVFKNNNWKKIWPFALVYLIVFLFNLSCLSLLIRAGLNAYVSQALLTLPVALLSYFLQRRFVF